MSKNVVSLVILVYKDIYIYIEKEMFIIYITMVYIYTVCLLISWS